jgi:hypothetical protein
MVDRYGVALIMIGVTIAVVFSVATTTWGGVLAVALGGGTLLFVLTTSDASARTVRTVRILVGLTLLATAVAAVVGSDTQVRPATFLAGGALAFIAPIAIVRRLRSHTRITAPRSPAPSACTCCRDSSSPTSTRSWGRSFRPRSPSRPSQHCPTRSTSASSPWRRSAMAT